MADTTTWTPISAPTDFQDDAVFNIDFKTKTVQVLVEQPIVAGENLSQFIKFQAPRFYDNIDLTEMMVNILYVSPAGNKGISAAVNTEYSDDFIRCGWLVPYAACPVKGTLLFVLEFVGADYTLKTTIASTPVLDSISDTDVVPEPVEQAWYITLQANVSAALQEAQTALGRIESIFNALSTPMSAGTAAEMVDESAIYVYTGSETGYTYGNWYYYDGSAWVSGGAYASTALVTDRTLSRDGQAADAGAVGSEIDAINGNLSVISKESDSDAENVDLDISDRYGNVLVRMADGHVQSRNFDSRDVYGVSGTRVELNLASYPVANGNFEEGRAWVGGAYKGVFIPRADLGDSVLFDATANKIVYAFMKDNVYASGQYPDVCSGTTIGRIATGGVITKDVPADCAYLYVYLSKNQSFVGTIHVYAITDSTKIKAEIAILQAQIDALKSQTGICYIADTEQILRTLKHSHSNSNDSFTSYTTNDDLAVIAHISDVHNDPIVYGHFISLLNAHVGVIDCGIATGDIVDQSNNAYIAEMLAVEENLETGAELLKVIGNHDRGTWPLSDLYSAFGFDTDTGKLYYTKDFADKKIRIIVLNQYDTESGQRGHCGHYSQEQLDWFCTQLQGAITNGYHVVVAYHSCSEAGLPTWNSKGFCQNVYSAFSESVSGEHIIEDIVNAFQTGGSLQKSITYPDTEITVSVNVTFSAKGVFVAFLCGHAHWDFIGYSKVYPSQLTCIIQGAVVTSSVRTEETARWQARYDTPRVAGTSTEDSFNVYAIDTTARLLKVAKIGSTLTDKLVPRSFATYGY